MIPKVSYSLNLSFDDNASDDDTLTNSNIQYVKINNDNTIHTNSKSPLSLVNKNVPRALQQVLSHFGVEEKLTTIANVSVNSVSSSKSENGPSFRANDLTFSEFQKIQEEAVLNSTANAAVSAKPKADLLFKNKYKTRKSPNLKRLNSKHRKKKRQQESRDALEKFVTLPILNDESIESDCTTSNDNSSNIKYEDESQIVTSSYSEESRSKTVESKKKKSSSKSCDRKVFEKYTEGDESKSNDIIQSSQGTYVSSPKSCKINSEPNSSYHRKDSFADNPHVVKIHDIIIFPKKTASLINDKQSDDIEKPLISKTDINEHQSNPLYQLNKELEPKGNINVQHVTIKENIETVSEEMSDNITRHKVDLKKNKDKDANLEISESDQQAFPKNVLEKKIKSKMKMEFPKFPISSTYSDKATSENTSFDKYMDKKQYHSINKEDFHSKELVMREITLNSNYANENQNGNKNLNQEKSENSGKNVFDSSVDYICVPEVKQKKKDKQKKIDIHNEEHDATMSHKDQKGNKSPASRNESFEENKLNSSQDSGVKLKKNHRKQKKIDISEIEKQDLDKDIDEKKTNKVEEKFPEPKRSSPDIYEDSSNRNSSFARDEQLKVESRICQAINENNSHSAQVIQTNLKHNSNCDDYQERRKSITCKTMQERTEKIEEDSVGSSQDFTSNLDVKLKKKWKEHTKIANSKAERDHVCEDIGERKTYMHENQEENKTSKCKNIQGKSEELEDFICNKSKPKKKRNEQTKLNKQDREKHYLSTDIEEKMTKLPGENRSTPDTEKDLTCNKKSFDKDMGFREKVEVIEKNLKQDLKCINENKEENENTKTTHQINEGVKEIVVESSQDFICTHEDELKEKKIEQQELDAFRIEDENMKIPRQTKYISGTDKGPISKKNSSMEDDGFIKGRELCENIMKDDLTKVSQKVIKLNSNNDEQNGNENTIYNTNQEKNKKIEKKQKQKKKEDEQKLEIIKDNSHFAVVSQKEIELNSKCIDENQKYKKKEVDSSEEFVCKEVKPKRKKDKQNKLDIFEMEKETLLKNIMEKKIKDLQQKTSTTDLDKGCTRKTNSFDKDEDLREDQEIRQNLDEDNWNSEDIIPNSNTNNENINKKKSVQVKKSAKKIKQNKLDNFEKEKEILLNNVMEKLKIKMKFAEENRSTSGTDTNKKKNFDKNELSSDLEIPRSINKKNQKKVDEMTAGSPQDFICNQEVKLEEKKYKQLKLDIFKIEKPVLPTNIKKEKVTFKVKMKFPERNKSTSDIDKNSTSKSSHFDELREQEIPQNINDMTAKVVRNDVEFISNFSNNNLRESYKDENKEKCMDNENEQELLDKNVEVIVPLSGKQLNKKVDKKKTPNNFDESKKGRDAGTFDTEEIVNKNIPGNQIIESEEIHNGESPKISGKRTSVTMLDVPEVNTEEADEGTLASTKRNKTKFKRNKIICYQDHEQTVEANKECIINEQTDEEKAKTDNVNNRIISKSELIGAILKEKMNSIQKPEPCKSEKKWRDRKISTSSVKIHSDSEISEDQACDRKKKLRKKLFDADNVPTSLKNCSRVVKKSREAESNFILIPEDDVMNCNYSKDVSKQNTVVNDQLVIKERTPDKPSEDNRSNHKVLIENNYLIGREDYCDKSELQQKSNEFDEHRCNMKENCEAIGRNYEQNNVCYGKNKASPKTHNKEIRTATHSPKIKTFLSNLESFNKVKRRDNASTYTRVDNNCQYEESQESPTLIDGSIVDINFELSKQHPEGEYAEMKSSRISVSHESSFDDCERIDTSLRKRRHKLPSTELDMSNNESDYSEKSNLAKKTKLSKKFETMPLTTSTPTSDKKSSKPMSFFTKVDAEGVVQLKINSSNEVVEFEPGVGEPNERIDIVDFGKRKKTLSSSRLNLSNDESDYSEIYTLEKIMKRPKKCTTPGNISKTRSGKNFFKSTSFSKKTEEEDYLQNDKAYVHDNDELNPDVEEPNEIIDKRRNMTLCKKKKNFSPSKLDLGHYKSDYSEISHSKEKIKSPKRGKTMTTTTLKPTSDRKSSESMSFGREGEGQDAVQSNETCPNDDVALESYVKQPSKIIDKKPLVTIRKKKETSSKLDLSNDEIDYSEKEHLEEKIKSPKECKSMSAGTLNSTNDEESLESMRFCRKDKGEAAVQSNETYPEYDVPLEPCIEEPNEIIHNRPFVALDEKKKTLSPSRLYLCYDESNYTERLHSKEKVKSPKEGKIMSTTTLKPTRDKKSSESMSVGKIGEEKYGVQTCETYRDDELPNKIADKRHNLALRKKKKKLAFSKFYLSSDESDFSEVSNSEERIKRPEKSEIMSPITLKPTSYKKSSESLSFGRVEDALPTNETYPNDNIPLEPCVEKSNEIIDKRNFVAPDKKNKTLQPSKLDLSNDESDYSERLHLEERVEVTKKGKTIPATTLKPSREKKTSESISFGKQCEEKYDVQNSETYPEDKEPNEIMDRRRNEALRKKRKKSSPSKFDLSNGESDHSEVSNLEERIRRPKKCEMMGPIISKPTSDEKSAESMSFSRKGEEEVCVRKKATYADNDLQIEPGVEERNEIIDETPHMALHKKKKKLSASKLDLSNDGSDYSERLPLEEKVKSPKKGKKIHSTTLKPTRDKKTSESTSFSKEGEEKYTVRNSETYREDEESNEIMDRRRNVALRKKRKKSSHSKFDLGNSESDHSEISNLEERIKRPKKCATMSPITSKPASDRKSAEFMSFSRTGEEEVSVRKEATYADNDQQIEPAVEEPNEIIDETPHVALHKKKKKLSASKLGLSDDERDYSEKSNLEVKINSPGNCKRTPATTSKPTIDEKSSESMNFDNKGDEEAYVRNNDTYPDDDMELDLDLEESNRIIIASLGSPRSAVHKKEIENTKKAPPNTSCSSYAGESSNFIENQKNESNTTSSNKDVTSRIQSPENDSSDEISKMNSTTTTFVANKLKTTTETDLTDNEKSHRLIDSAIEEDDVLVNLSNQNISQLSVSKENLPDREENVSERRKKKVLGKDKKQRTSNLKEKRCKSRNIMEYFREANEENGKCRKNNTMLRQKEKSIPAIKSHNDKESGSYSFADILSPSFTDGLGQHKENEAASCSKISELENEESNDSLSVGDDPPLSPMKSLEPQQGNESYLSEDYPFVPRTKNTTSAISEHKESESYSFANILSESHRKRLEKKIDRIFVESSKKSNTSENVDSPDVAESNTDLFSCNEGLRLSPMKRNQDYADISFSTGAEKRGKTMKRSQNHKVIRKLSKKKFAIPNQNNDKSLKNTIREDLNAAESNLDILSLDDGTLCTNRGNYDVSLSTGAPKSRKTKKSEKIHNMVERMKDRILTTPEREMMQAEERNKKAVELIKKSKSIWEIQKKLKTHDKKAMKNKIEDLKIVNPYPLTRIQKIASYVGIHPSVEQKERIEKEGIVLKLGYFSKEEDDKITSNWQEFCELHNWDKDDYSPFFRSKKAKHGVLPIREMRNFAQFISHNFEDRTMFSVMSRFIRIFKSKQSINRNFSKEEDRVIKAYIRKEESREPFADMETILHRPRKSILRRCCVLASKKKIGTKRIFWNKSITEKFLVILAEVTCRVSLSELKDYDFTAEEWDQVAEKMKYPAASLKKAWLLNFHPRLFINNYTDELKATKRKLIDLLTEKYYECSDIKEVDWKSVANIMDQGWSGLKYYKIFRNLMRGVPEPIQRNLKDTLSYLKDSKFTSGAGRFRYIGKILEETKNGTILPKLREDGMTEDNLGASSSEAEPAEDEMRSEEL